jgi:hypothetical protein
MPGQARHRHGQHGQVLDHRYGGTNEIMKEVITRAMGLGAK